MADITCKGTLKAVSLDPALCAFFGIESSWLSSVEVDVEFIVHNTWKYGYPGIDQRLTLTSINGIKLNYDALISSQDGQVDLWGTVDSEKTAVNIIIGIDRFQITNITKSSEPEEGA